MNINLDNYEQYLLMYVDNELSAAERMQVDNFLRDYPYLAEELEILQQTVLPLENVLFDKSSLLKPIIDEATREKLLMHLDGELPAGESLALQHSLKSDKTLQKEWAQLQKTKLDAADVIEHPDKESLYRRERTRVITFVRWAAAAIFIGAALYTGFNLLNTRKNGQVDVAVNDGPAKNNVDNTNSINGKKDQNNTAITDPVNTKDELPVMEKDKEDEIPVTKEDQPVKNNMLATNTSPGNNKKKANNDVPVIKQQGSSDIANNKKQDKKNDLVPKQLQQRNIDNVLKNDNDYAAIEKQKNNNSIDLPTNINTSKRPVVDKLLTESANSYAQTASLGFNDNNQDQVLMMEEENVSRSKAAIFLKKLKRNVERRTNMKPGKSLRIAGFEFAVK